MKTLIFITIAAVLLGAGIFVFWPSSPGNKDIGPTKNSASGQQNSLQTQASAQKNELIIGQADAPATIIEYIDFKCPSCNRFHHEAGQQLRENYVKPGKLKIIYRNLPFIGPDSYRAAEGAYCAHEQQKFTEYHDGVYNFIWGNYYNKGNLAAEFEDILTAPRLSELAGSIGMDTAAFDRCLKERRYDSSVKADLKASEKDVVTGTPFFVINGQTVAGPQPYSVFKTLVELQLR